MPLRTHLRLSWKRLKMRRMSCSLNDLSSTFALRSSNAFFNFLFLYLEDFLRFELTWGIQSKHAQHPLSRASCILHIIPCDLVSPKTSSYSIIKHFGALFAIAFFWTIRFCQCFALKIFYTHLHRFIIASERSSIQIFFCFTNNLFYIYMRFIIHF